MQKKYKFVVDTSDIRVDLFLANKLPNFSRTTIQNSIKSNLVMVNNQLAKTSTKVNFGDIINGEIKEKQVNQSIVPQNIPLDILFEDDEIIVINKSSGLVVHPGNGNKDGTLVNSLAYHFKELSNTNNLRPGIIHRLDKETSGVIVVAKTNKAHAKVSNQFLNKEVKKIYFALVWGEINKKGFIDGFINRDNNNRTKYKVSLENGKISKTKYYSEGYFPPLSLVRIKPETGRTHQIRVHLSSIGHPIFSDVDYSGGKKRIKSYHVKYTNILKRLFKCINRVALHAKTIEFKHPKNDKVVSFSAPIPNDFKEALKILSYE